ncbi:MAG: hypothetical protein QOH61_2203 [Chloroflexota bacterium]|jgi:putative copper resistance protein D|nr:hypothetical protein [Chloroflexota bacterium]
MRRRPLLVAVVVVIALSVAVALGGGLIGGTPDPTNPVPATVDSIDRGAALYGSSCAACHGADARGGGPMAGTTAVQPPALTGPSSHLGHHSDGQLYQIISGGLPGGMPSWAGKLSEQDIWDLVNFLRSIQAP